MKTNVTDYRSMALLGVDEVRRALSELDARERAAVPTNPIARPGACYVLGCIDPVLRQTDGAALVARHQRFGAVHTCGGHHPEGRQVTI